MKTVLVKSLKQVFPFLFCLTLIASAARAASYTYETFDVPSAVETWAQGINDSGQVTGWYTGRHGFVRKTDGSITTFDNMSAYCNGSGSTRAFAINGSGQVAGYCLGGYYGYHYGFVRSADGLTYTPAINDPNVVHIFDTDVSGTSVTGVNDSGQVTGYYTVSTATHGFLTNADHTQFTTIDYPSANAGTTYARGINNSGQVTGYYVSGPGYHGFVRNADGSFTPFEVPNSTLGFTYAYGINSSGQVVGSYKGTDNVFHGFMRSADGLTYTKIDYPSASLAYAYSINNNGQVTGIYKLSDGIVHGFIATPVAMQVLSIAFVGTGSGTVTSTAPDASINCTKGSSSGCSASYPLNTSVTLAATGNWKSLFAGWSGGLTSSANPVTFTMGNTMPLTATLNLNYEAKLLPANSLFASIQDAYASVSSGSMTILVQSGSFPEDLIFGNVMAVTLSGGMDSSYNPTSGFSTVRSLTVGSGSAVIGNISIS